MSARHDANPTPTSSTSSRAENPRDAAKASSPIERVLTYLDGLAQQHFYGRVTVSFQNGKVHDVKIEQTKKLEEL
jgi:hypothetical protein